ncbi:hypothetical protein J4217_04220 [Candidatus Pacearchaeota archaeon]|nr:hypothetical protein [Candidatus Pacearchaeota archaeon]
MMIFIAERVSNKDFIQLERDVRRIVSALEKAGHKSKCTFIDYADNPKKFDGWNEKDYLDHALKFLDGSDAILLFVNSENRSEGLLMEAGYSIAKKKRIILAINSRVRNTYLNQIAEKTIRFDSVDNLCKELEALK